MSPRGANTDDQLEGGQSIYNTQLLLDPMPEGEQRFDRDSIERMPIDAYPDPQTMWLYIRVDPAISEKRTADEMTIILGGVHWSGRRYILDGWGGREKRPTEQVRMAYRLAKTWKEKGFEVKNIGIESVAYQEALAELCRLGVPTHDPKYDGERVEMMTKPCSIISITRPPNKRKGQRIMQMEGAVSRDELRIWKKCPIIHRCMNELRGFPFSTDNFLDSMRDLFERAPVPSRPLIHAPRVVHKEVEALLKLAVDGKRPKPEGLSQTVQLETWR